MEVELRKVSELVFDPRNARKHDRDNISIIKISLKTFGQQKPIVIDKENVVVAGNGTLQAAKELGWEEIKCVVTGLDSTLKTAYAIADNRSAELAEWDTQELLDQLTNFQIEGLDLEVVGFDMKEFNKLSKDETKDKPLREQDEFPIEWNAKKQLQLKATCAKFVPADTLNELESLIREYNALKSVVSKYVTIKE